MFLFSLIVLVVLSVSYGLPIITPDEITTEVIDGKLVYFKWVKILSCTEGQSNQVFTRSRDRTDNEILGLASTANSIRFSPPRISNGILNPDYNNFNVFSKPNEYPSRALNLGLGVGCSYNSNTAGYSGPAQLDKWVGSDKAKSRLETSSCNYGQNALPFLDNIYWANGNGGGIHLGYNNPQYNNVCNWDWADLTGQNLEVWFGYTYTPVADEITTEVIDGNLVQFEWYRILSCTEGQSNQVFTRDHDRTDNEILGLAKTANSIRFSPPRISNGILNPDYDNFNVFSSPNEYPSQALNLGLGVGCSYSSNTGGYSGPAQLDKWIGTDIAKSRLTTSSCNYGQNALPFLDNIYWANGNGAGIHLGYNNPQYNNVCNWDWADLTGQNLEVWFGYIVSTRKRRRRLLDTVNM